MHDVAREDGGDDVRPKPYVMIGCVSVILEDTRGHEQRTVLAVDKRMLWIPLVGVVAVLPGAEMAVGQEDFARALVQNDRT